jgi:hypothetical protein
LPLWLRAKTSPTRVKKFKFVLSWVFWGQIQNMLMQTFFAYILTSLIPGNFLIQLAQDKKGEVANCDHFRNLEFSKAQPFAFTGLGAIQAANVLGSSQAVPLRHQSNLHR